MAKLNSYDGLDKSNTMICLRGDTQIKDDLRTWSTTSSTRLRKPLITDLALNNVTIYQLDFIQAFI